MNTGKLEIKKEHKERKIQEIINRIKPQFGNVEKSFIKKFAEMEFEKYYTVK